MGRLRRSSGPTKADADGTQLIDLRLLEPSPLHHRTAPSSEEQAALERSIAAEGLKHPIEARPRGEKFQIICGHRRAEAYRSLFHRATTDSERALLTFISKMDGQAYCFASHSCS